MIYNTNYQLLVANAVLDSNDHYDGDLVNKGVAGLASLKEGQIAIVNEDDPNSSISNWAIDNFSLYQKTRNDKGKLVLTKHAGAKPVAKANIKTKSFNKATKGVGQYWQLVIKHGFQACCQDYTIRFSISNEQIYKSQFPNYLIHELSVKKACCEEACGNDTNPFTDAELAFMIWHEAALNSKGYLRADIALDNTGFKNIITKHDDNGRAYFSFTHNSTHTATAYYDTYKDGKIYVNDADSSGNNKNLTIAELFTLAGFTEGTDDIAIRFEIVPEEDYVSGNINLKYDNIRNTVADMVLLGGFECLNSDDVEFYKNDNANYSKIYKDSSNSVGEFTYPVGAGYDVKNMETYDSRRTLNSPYPFSDYTFSESGIRYRTDENKMYHLVSFGYQEQSDTLGGGINYGHGTTIAIESMTSAGTINLYNSSDSTAASSKLVQTSTTTTTNWDKFIKTTLGLSVPSTL